MARSFVPVLGAGTAAFAQRVVTATDDLGILSLGIMDDWDESDRAKVNVIVGQAGITAGAGAVAANTPRVTHASDDPVTVSVQLIDDAIFTDDTSTHATGTTKGVGIMATATPTDAAVNANDIGMLAMSLNRELLVSLNTAIPAGTNNIGDVDVLTVPADPFGLNADAASQTGSISAKLKYMTTVGQLIFGALSHDAPQTGYPPVTIGAYAKAAAPTDVSADGDVVQLWALRNGSLATTLTAAGALIGGDAANGLDVDVTRIASGAIAAGAIVAGATSIAENEDVGAADGDRGVKVLFRRANTAASSSGADGDYQFPITNTRGATWVAIEDGAGGQITSFGGGTQYTEDAAAAADPVGTAPILVRKDTPATTVSADGDNIAQRGSNYGAAYVTLLDSSGAFVSVGGGTQYTEDAAAAADPIGTMAMMRRKDTLSSSEVSADGDNIAPNATSRGEQYVFLDPRAGTIAKTEDVASADADVGVAMMAIQQSTPADTAGTNADYAMLQMSGGGLWTRPLLKPFAISVDVTRPADTTAYAANDALSDSTSSPTSGGFTFSNAARASGGSGIITDAIITTSADASTLLQGEIWIFNTSVTNINDNSAFAVSDSEIKTYVGKIPFVMEDAGNNGSYHATNLNIGFTCSGSANLRFLVKVKNAYTPANAEVLTFVIKGLQYD